MGIPVSLFLIAVGAILAFAVTQGSNASVDLDVVGWILMIVGLVGLLLSLLLWERLGPGAWRRGRYDTGAYPRRAGSPRRRTVVEEDEVAPPGPPPEPPPP